MIFGLDLILSALSGIIVSALGGHELMQYTAINNIISKTIWALVLVFIIKFDLGIIGMAVGTALTTLIGGIYLYIIYKSKFGWVKLIFDKKFWKKLFIEAWPFTLTGIFVLVYWKIDLVMLSFYQTDAIVGWYSAAYKLLELLMIAPVIIMTPLYPVFSRLAKDNKEKLQNVFKLVVRYLLIVMLPIIIGVMLVGDKIIVFIYGEQFINSAIVLKILIFATLFAFINYPFLTLLNSTGDQKRGTIQTGVSAAANVVLNIFFIPLLSYIGAAITTVISEGLFLLLSYIYIKKKGFKINYLSIIIKPLIAALIMAIFIYYFSSLNLILLIACAGIIYALSILALREIGKQDFDLLKAIMKK
jgi:O-antigen/teichoic acid export membrane protein